MNLFQELGLFFRAKNTIQNEIKEAKTMDTSTGVPTPSWKTGEFWSQILLVDVPSIIGAATGIIPGNIAGYILLGSRTVYTISRLWFKRDVFMAAIKSELGKLKSGDLTDVTTAVDKVTTTNVTVNP